MADNLAAVPMRPNPDGVELRHLRAFVAVADELNFGRAAGRLYLSQPALSRQIRALERLVGCELLRRTTHRTELTLAGEALLERARWLLTAVEEAITVTQSVGGEINERIMRLWLPFMDVASSAATLGQLREQFEIVLAQSPLPSELSVRPVSAGGVPALVVGVEPRILFLHGGGFVVGSAYGYRPLVGALADAAQAGALLVDYRLAPEHPFPAAFEDAMTAYRWIVDRCGDPARVVLVGDSTGSGLVLATLRRLVEAGEPMPAAAVLLCPVVELSGRLLLPSDERNVMDEIWRSSQLALGAAVEDPLMRQLAADLSGLPPMLIQSATGDRARPEAEALAEHARKHGVDVKLELYPGDTHVFHIHWSFLAEAADALRQAGQFIQHKAGPSQA